MDIKLGLKRILLLSFVGASFFAVSCDDDVLNNLTSGDTVAALKEALTIGAKTAATNLGQKDGYYGDAMVKIGMPQEVATVAELMSTSAGKTFLSAIGAEGLQTDNLIELMNRAAEKAAPESAEIFANAITKMTVADGESILFGKYTSQSANEEGNVTASFGSDKAATSYLYDKTYSGLQTTFGSVVTSTFDQVSVSGLTLNNAWSSFSKGYNQIAEKKSTTGGKVAMTTLKAGLALAGKSALYDKVDAIQTVNTNLGEYVTGKALDGLFTKVADKEVDIRTNAAARTSDLLKRVFGRLDE
ncbi:MAG: DUF4197 domain-containing protein [Paludibacteraceae bacterium]|nr:DUF4197 domain-containing protein [Paludibacteraceae bacterium]